MHFHIHFVEFIAFRETVKQQNVFDMRLKMQQLWDGLEGEEEGDE
jgi:hypothetical protein